MAFQIRISPVAVRIVAQRHRAIAESIENTASEFSALVSELEDSWDGGASFQAIESLQNIRAAAGRVANGVSDSADMLTGVARAFESVDDGEISMAYGVIKPIHMVGCPAPGPMFSLGINESLRIVPEQVRNVAHKLRERAEIFTGIGNDYRATISDLSNNWEGNAYIRFADAAMELTEAFPQIAELLDELAERIITIANRYEELDEALRSMF